MDALLKTNSGIYVLEYKTTNPLTMKTTTANMKSTQYIHHHRWPFLPNDNGRFVGSKTPVYSQTFDPAKMNKEHFPKTYAGLHPESIKPIPEDQTKRFRATPLQLDQRRMTPVIRGLQIRRIVEHHQRMRRQAGAAILRRRGIHNPTPAQIEKLFTANL